ncbi:MAG: hypothetical protein ACLTR6_16335 [Clostridium fessum]
MNIFDKIMGKIKRSEAQKYAKQQKRQAQMQRAAASQKEEGQKMPENRRRERETFEKRQQTEMKLSDEMLETIRKNAEQRFAMRKEEAREEKMSGESRESSVQRQIDGDGLIGEWEERYGKRRKSRSVRKVRKRNRCAGKRIKRKRKTVIGSLSVRWIRSAKSAARRSVRMLALPRRSLPAAAR